MGLLKGLRHLQLLCQSQELSNSRGKTKRRFFKNISKCANSAKGNGVLYLNSIKFLVIVEAASLSLSQTPCIELCTVEPFVGHFIRGLSLSLGETPTQTETTN